MKGFLLAVCVTASLAFPLASVGYEIHDANPACYQIYSAVEVGSQGHVSLILHDNWRQIPAEVAMERQFRLCLAPTGGVVPHLYTASSAVYRARVVDSQWPIVIPAVIQQDPDGRVVEQVQAPLIPTWFQKRPWLSMRPWLRPRGGCPGGVCPEPAVEPPAEPPAVNVEAPIYPPPEPIKEESPVALIVLVGLLIVLAFAVGAVIPVVRHFKNR